MTNDDPRYDLAAWINGAQESGMAETDPYSYATTVIARVLEFALDDGISGSMSKKEFSLLEKVAITLIEEDSAIEINPRVA